MINKDFGYYFGLNMCNQNEQITKSWQIYLFIFVERYSIIISSSSSTTVKIPTCLKRLLHHMLSMLWNVKPHLSVYVEFVQCLASLMVQIKQNVFPRPHRVHNGWNMSMRIIWLPLELVSWNGTLSLSLSHMGQTMSLAKQPVMW